MRKKQLRDKVASHQATIAKLNVEIGRLKDEHRQVVTEYEADLSAARARLERAQKPNNRPKLTGTQVYEIRVKHRFYGASQKDLATQYGVNPATISRIVRGVYHR